MPLPPIAAQPYDTVNVILNTVQHRLNDKISTLQPQGGQILDNTDAFSNQVFNTAYRTFQQQLSGLGVSRLNKEIILTGCPIVASTDPASQTYVDWFVYFNAVNSTSTPVLPSDLIAPIWMMERQTGMNACFPMNPNMENMVGGIPGYQKWQANRFWQWRDNKIYMPGSLFSMDLRIGYSAFLPDIVDVGSTRWWTLPVPIMRCLNPLAWYICAEFTVSLLRGETDSGRAAALGAIASGFREQGEAETRQVYRRDVQMNQAVNVRRQAYSRRSRGGWGC